MLCGFLDSFRGASLGSMTGGRMDQRTALTLAAAIFLALMPLEISHLLSMIAGAGGYLLLQALQPKMQRQPIVAKATRAAPKFAAPRATSGGGAVAPPVPTLASLPRPEAARPWRPSRALSSGPGCASPAARAPVASPAAATFVQKVEVWKPSAVPVAAPTFQAKGFEAEVRELLGRIAPSTESDAAVRAIAQAVQRAIRSALPQAEVAAFACGNPLSGTAFGVAVPEVDIVVSTALQREPLQRQPAVADLRKLQKSAIRACTDRLVDSGAFKFRRSAFRGAEPKVTLVAQLPGQGRSQGPVQVMPINLYVNAETPSRCAALVTESGRLEARATDLILLVRRWAKDRGLSHAAKGHFSPYCWTLLAIYFLQVGLEQEEEEGRKALLPPLKGFVAHGTPLALIRGSKPSQKQAGELFQAFALFYSEHFDWRNEAISVRLGRRAPPEVSLPLHIVLHEDGHTSEVGPSIEDPFETSSNLGACTTATSLARIHGELARARDLCAKAASLSELLVPWAPPAAEAEDQE